jgi:hypothetical protein
MMVPEPIIEQPPSVRAQEDPINVPDILKQRNPSYECKGITVFVHYVARYQDKKAL